MLKSVLFTSHYIYIHSTIKDNKHALTKITPFPGRTLALMQAVAVAAGSIAVN